MDKHQIKPVVSMVHRLQSRNAGYVDNSVKSFVTNQPTLRATEGATALNINTLVEQHNDVLQTPLQKEVKKISKEPSLENVSMENAAYLQSIEREPNDQDMETFEVESIELANPELFSKTVEEDSFNQDNTETEPTIFENSKLDEEIESQIESKEPEMFDESNLEEDFEIPAFLRKQKN